MLNIDKVRGIMRANQGLQYPYDILNGGMQGDGTRNYLYPQISDPTLESPYLVGSPIPIPGKSDDLYKIDHQPQHQINFPNIDFEPTFPKQSKYSSMTQQSLDTALGKDTTKYKYSGLTNSDQLLQKTLDKKSSLLSQGLQFLKNNQTAQSVVDLGLDYLGNQFEKGVTNNKGSQAIFGMADLAANGLFMANPVLGLGAKAAVTLAKGANKWFGKQSDSYHVDKELEAKMGGSYTGSYKYMHDTEDKLNQFYGWASSGSRRNANRHGQIVRGIEANIEDIADTAYDQRAMVNDSNRKRYEIQTNGGYNIALNVKQGGTLIQKINLVKSRKFNQVINVNTKQVGEFKEGGKLTNTDWEPVIELFGEWEPEIILEVEEFQKGGKTRTLEELIGYAKEQNPRFIQRLSEEPRGIKFIDDEGNEAKGSHYLESRGEYVIPRIQEINGELKFLSGQDAIERAIESGNYLKMLPEEAIIFAENYKQGWPEFFEKFKDGGKTKEELETPEIEETNQKNLIPEGALHKNKHHMEHTEGLTQKGIPVIDNDGEQQAEIELDEIIFTLEVTKKLEELYKEGTDEAAIEAGKLLVKEILFNTDDRTGLIAKCQEGGKL